MYIKKKTWVSVFILAEQHICRFEPDQGVWRVLQGEEQKDVLKTEAKTEQEQHIAHKKSGSIYWDLKITKINFKTKIYPCQKTYYGEVAECGFENSSEGPELRVGDGGQDDKDSIWG